jgi:hypothetical protein
LVADNETLGGSNPLLADLTSSIEDGSGVLLSILMLTWAAVCNQNAKTKIRSTNFFIRIGLRVRPIVVGLHRKINQSGAITQEILPTT